MATHYVYEDPDRTQLGQGDILYRTAELKKLLNEFHPHYAQNQDYKFFTILTQSCDLVCREGDHPKTQYISIAAARTLQETLIREAAKSQNKWQKEAKVISQKSRGKLLEFLQRLMDNNEPGYFYLHEDQGLKIHTSCCVVLSLSVALRSEHYSTLLDAKLGQLKDTFQAKLGWLIGSMYSRVGTTEWNHEYQDNHLKDATKNILDQTMNSVSEEQIKEGVSELKRNGEFDNLSATDIFEYIRKQKILSRSKKFENRAITVSENIKLVSLIQGRATTAIHNNNALKNTFIEILTDSHTKQLDNEQIADILIQTMNDRLGEVMTDSNLPDRNKVTEKFIRGILQDPQIAKILS